jgi:hypothetical protein
MKFDIFALLSFIHFVTDLAIHQYVIWYNVQVVNKTRLAIAIIASITSYYGDILFLTAGTLRHEIGQENFIHL